MATAPGPVPPRSDNRLLTAFPAADRDRLVARMSIVAIKLKDVLYRANGPIQYVYFPRSGVLSLIAVLPNGGAAEVGTAGNEGMAGLGLLFGNTCSANEVICQADPCDAWRLPADAFRAEADRPGPVRDVLLRYAGAYLHMVSQTAACNALHGVEERLARWLLMTHDRVGADVLPLTQEFLALMLGVRRSTVTLVAGPLQAAGLIRYTRGRITVVDRPGLEAAACECYQIVRAEYDRLLP